MPPILMMDYVFKTYGWTEQEFKDTTYMLWEELQTAWAARGFVQGMKSKAPEAENTSELVSLAKREGFDVDPSWEEAANAEVNDND